METGSMTMILKKATIMPFMLPPVDGNDGTCSQDLSKTISPSLKA